MICYIKLLNPGEVFFKKRLSINKSLKKGYFLYSRFLCVFKRVFRENFIK